MLIQQVHLLVASCGKKNSHRNKLNPVFSLKTFENRSAHQWHDFLLFIIACQREWSNIIPQELPRTFATLKHDRAVG
jgi:hypothetical protein